MTVLRGPSSVGGVIALLAASSSLVSSLALAQTAPDVAKMPAAPVTVATPPSAAAPGAVPVPPSAVPVPPSAVPVPPSAVPVPYGVGAPQPIVPGPATTPADPATLVIPCVPPAPPGYGYVLMALGPDGAPVLPTPPPSAAPAKPPARPLLLDYAEGAPIPPGYHLEKRTRDDLVTAGAVTFGVPYAISFLVGGSLATGDTRAGQQHWPLMLPVVGPFATIATADATGVGTFWLMVDGLAQAAGAGMLIGGLVAKKPVLVRNPDVSAYLPEVHVGPGRASASWTF